MLAAIAIPEGLATARLAGMPPQSGLYAFAGGSLAFALFGTNRYLSVGADSTIAPIFAGAIMAIAAGNPAHYSALVVVTTLFTGVALLAAGAARAGWIADLLSIPVTIGFLAGVAVHIVVGQLPAILGVPGSSGSLLSALAALVRNAPHASASTLLLGAGVFLVTLGAERLNARFPGALLALVAAGLAVATFHLSARGVAVLGPLPTAVPQVRLTLVDAHDALQLVPVALIVALVCMVQTAVVLREFPSQPDASGDPSRDFAAVGIGSIVAACFGAFAVNASPPRTAIAASSGGRSQLTGIVAVLAIGLLALFGAKLASYLPLAALAGVLLFIATRIFRLGDMLRIARLGGWEIWLVLSGALLVVVFPIEIGMVLAIGLSLLHGIYIVARPPSTELVRIPGTTIWWPPGDHPGERVRGVLVFSPAAPITFTNGQYIVSRLRGLVAAVPQPIRLVVLEGGGVIDVDYTGAVFVRAAIADLRKSGIRVALARFESERARSAAKRTGLLAAVGSDSVFDSVHEALSALDDLSAPARTRPQHP